MSEAPTPGGFRVALHGTRYANPSLGMWVGLALIVIIFGVILIPALVLGLVLYAIASLVRAVGRLFAPAEARAGRRNVRVVRR